MSYEILILLSIVFACANSQDTNQLCPCDTESDQKDNSELWSLLRTLSGDVSKENEALYAVPAGNLYQFDCSRCDEKLRKKRRIMLENEPEIMPIQVAKEEVEEDEDRGKRNVVHPRFRVDLRCPKDTYWIAHSCVPIENFESEDSAEV